MHLPELQEFASELHGEKDPAHDYTHIERVLSLCKKNVPPEADIDLVMQAAPFQGVLRGNEAKIRSFLESLGYQTVHIERIISTVRNARSVAVPETTEEKVLHDANILDALGAIGIARAFAKGGFEHQTISETVEIMKRDMERELYTPKAKKSLKEERIS